MAWNDRAAWRRDWRWDRRFDRRYDRRFARRAFFVGAPYYSSYYYPSYYNDYYYPSSYYQTSFYPEDYYYDQDYYVAPTPVQYTTVAANSTVIAVQQQLASAGFYRGPIDGIMGPMTRTAIVRFERSRGLPTYVTINRPLLVSLGLA